MGEVTFRPKTAGSRVTKSPATSTIARARSSRAFTLFELLMAMSVIAIIAGITFAKVDLRIFRDTPTAGVRTLSDLMRVARTQAVLNGVPARLIINYDEDDHERFLRYAGVVVANQDDDGMLDGKWIAVDRGVYLPTGAYVVPRDGSKVSFAADWGSGRKSRYDITNGSGIAVFTYKYPMSDPVSEGIGEAWIALQFGPNGQLQAATDGGIGSAPVGNYFVVGRARQQGEKALLFMDGETVKGIGVKRSGALFSIDDVDYYETKVGGGDEDEADEDATGT